MNVSQILNIQLTLWSSLDEMLRVRRSINRHPRNYPNTFKRRIDEYISKTEQNLAKVSLLIETQEV